jgi:ABC-type glycerol-3-phosphate transport system substrate-binding protein
VRRLLVTLGLAAVVALTGCGGGGGKKDAAAAPSTTVPPPTTTTVPVGNDQAGTPFCKLAQTYNEKFSTLLTVANDPVKLRAALTDAESAIRQAQSTAPAAIKSDVTTVATTASQVLTALQRNNFDLSKTPEAVSRLQDPQFQTSLSNVTRYGRAHCGIT